MKVKASVKAKKDSSSKLVRRNGTLYVIDKQNPRNKRRQG